MKNTYGYLLLIIIIGLLLFKINNASSTNIKEPLDVQQIIKSNSTNINPMSNSVDTYYLKEKSKNLSDLYKKLNTLKEFLHNQPLDKIIQFKCVEKNEKNHTHDNNKFAVKLSSPDNFNNVYTISVPSGEIGPQGPPGEQGAQGPQGPRGDKGPTGNCGLLIK